MRSALLALIVIVGCAAPPLPSSDPAEARSTAGGYELTFSLPRSVWRVDEAIQGEAILRLIGDGSTTLSGSGGGPFSFRFEGEGLEMSPVQTLDCTRYAIDVDTPIVSDIRKSGAFDGDDPNHDFYIRWFHDPELHLPPGEWQIRAIAEFYEGTECEGAHRAMGATVELQVVE